MEPNVITISAGPFFPRGEGPLVSVMLPTRGRSTQLLDSVYSCINTAKDPTKLEFIIKMDDDDHDTIKQVCILASELAKQDIWVQEIRSPRGNGFLDIHHWYNKLMWPEARGDWLLLWNDDSRMLTDGWDEIVRTIVIHSWHGCPGDVCTLVPETNDEQSSNETIMVRRKSCEIMGHVFGSPYGDSWLLQVMAMVDSVCRVPEIKVKHLRLECSKENDTVRTDTDKCFSVGINSLQSVPAMLQKMADAAKLLASIQARESSVLWTSKPARTGWHRWKSTLEEQARNVFITDDNRAAVFDGGYINRLLTLSDMSGYWWPMLEQ